MSRSDAAAAGGRPASFRDRLDRLGATAMLSPLFPDLVEPQAPPAVLDEDTSDELVGLCLENRLGPLLALAVSDGHLAIHEGAMARLSEGVQHLLATQLRVERCAVAMVDLLNDAGIEFRVLKGLATAYLDYPNPALRTFGDVDLLVRPVDVPGLMRVLEASGRGHFLPIRGDDWRIQHAVTFVLDGIEVDLHHRLLHQAAGHRAAKLELFGSTDWFQLGGRRVGALPRELRLLQAAAQNVLGGLRDRKITSELDAALLADAAKEAFRLASRCGLGFVLHEGLQRSSILDPMDRGFSIPRLAWDRLFRLTYGGSAASVRGSWALEIVAAPLPLAALQLLRTVSPGDEYLDRRRRGWPAHMGRQFRRLTRW